MTRYAAAELADRAGVSGEDAARVMEVGILAPGPDGRFNQGDVRRMRLVHALDRAGVPLDGLAAAKRNGEISFAFLDQPFYDRFASLSDLTFAQLANETAIPMELLSVVREAIGFAQPRPDDSVREDELRIVRLVQRLLAIASRPPSTVERLLRVWGESLGRVADVEGEWWRSEVEAPLLKSGMNERQMLEAANRLSPELAGLQEQVVLEIYHARHEHAATANIVEDVERALAKAGLYSRLARPPAICFLDISGYTRLTEEGGDEAAAAVADRLGRHVRQVSASRGGRTIKWLGDGVMFYFPDPGAAVSAAIEMVEGANDAGLPPARMGVHAGPILFQEGDYFGRTVNVAARIAEYARSGEVLVSGAVVEAAQASGIIFSPIGAVELKGVSEVMELHSARRGEGEDGSGR